MALRLSRRGLIAGATAVAVAVSGAAAPSTVTMLAGPVAVAETALPVPGFAGYIPPALLGQPITLVATVEAGTEGQIEFVQDNGTVLGVGEIKPATASDGTPIGRAEVTWTAPKAGTYKIKARVLGSAGTQGEFSELFDVAVGTPGSSVDVEVDGELNRDQIIAATLGIGASLVALLGGHSTIPAIEAATTHAQKQLGIYNEDLAKKVKQALPMVGGLLGGIGLITSLAFLIKALVDGKITVTSSRS